MVAMNVVHIVSGSTAGASFIIRRGVPIIYAFVTIVTYFRRRVGYAAYMTDTQYDYTNQAWVVDGHYAECGHVTRRADGTTFRYSEVACFACHHAGEPVQADASTH